jgi:hypothetical protein
MKSWTLVILLGWVSSVLAEDSTTAVTIPTAVDGDQVVLFSTESKRPIPAKDDKVEIIGANIAFMPRPDDATKVHWGWNFVAHFTGKAKPIYVLVEDETRAPLTTMVESMAPNLREGLWAGIASTKPLSKQFIAFVESGQPMFRMFRFTIKYEDGSTSKLHQASLHDSATLKSMIVAVAKTLE